MKLVKLKEIFDIEYGNQFDLNKMIEVDSHSGSAIAFISRTSKNNGVATYVKEYNNCKSYPRGLITVTLGGTYLLSTFIQQKPFYTAQNIKVLRPKVEMSIEEKLYYCAAIRANRFRYTSHGREANKTLDSIKVPDLQEVREIASNFKTPAEPKKEAQFSSDLNLTDRNWVWFVYEDIFKILKGRRLTKSDMQVGKTPFIGAIDSNNGVSGYITRKSLFNKNTITVSYNGSVGEAFYQPNEYWASDDINVLNIDSVLNPYLGMFLATLIKKEKYRFNYGRKWHKARMEKSKIKLPVDSDGNPDWQFMEDYIKSLPYSSNL